MEIIQFKINGYASVQRDAEGDGKECCSITLPPGWKGKNIVCILTDK